MNFEFQRFALVAIPGGLPENLTYGIPAPYLSHIQRGSVVWVPLARRSKPLLGLVLQVMDKAPNFKVKPLEIHASEHRFDEPFVEALEWLARYYGVSTNRTVDVFWPAQLDQYLQVAHGLKEERKKTPRSTHTPQDLPALNSEQQQAIEQVAPLWEQRGFRGVLLHGVTGSGKTRVYLELVQHALQHNQNVLILVPEIALTPQTHLQFATQLSVPVFLYHSGLSAPQKRATWTALLRQEARVILGTRSSSLSPHLNPGLIIVDEEHDLSYKQQDPSPRYHCRELLFHWAHRNHALVILGSATPSLENWFHAQNKHLQKISLRQRAVQVPLPQVHVEDLRKLRQDRDLLLSPRLREALQKTLEQGQQAIVLHNRRGHSTTRTCLKCGQIAECQNCKVPLVFHQKNQHLRCHYCDRLYQPHMPCSHCGHQAFLFEGGAIERVEAEIQELIPQARVIRLDRDTTQRIGASEKILQQFRAHEFDILLGTQMVAKGHDFPSVQLVGVIRADAGAALPDFRSHERMFQLLTQVAGRAGRAQRGGQVILQTYDPDHPVLQFALKHDYIGFAEWELAQRQDSGYPPYRRLLCIQLSSRQQDLLRQTGQQIAQFCQTYTDISVLGPTDAFIPFVKGNYRQQLLLKSRRVSLLHTIMDQLNQKIQNAAFPKVDIKLDLDP